MSDTADRLRRRFQERERRPREGSGNKNRERQSFYLDADLTKSLDKKYKDLNHELYPNTISKSMFLETILEYGLENIDTIKLRFTTQDTPSPQE